MRISILSLILTVSLAAVAPSGAEEPTMPSDQPPTDQLRDVTEFTLPVADTPRGRQYMAVFDHAASQVLERFDVDKGLVEHEIPDGAPGIPPEVAELERHSRKRYIGPLTHWAYGVGRSSASMIGALAYAWSQPLSRYYGDEEVLRAVCNGFEAFIEHQSPEGEFVWTPIRYSSVYSTHEMAWRLENFIIAYFCIRDSITDDQRERYWAFLNRAMRFLQATPCDHMCNRGVVWSAVMTMCWKATGDEGYLRDARAVWTRIQDAVFQENGVVLESQGPCTVYSPVSYEYLIRYYLMTRDDGVRQVLERATEWMSEMYFDQWVAFLGVSTRYDNPGSDHDSARLLPGYELLVADHPEYADLAKRALDQTSEHFPTMATSHGAISWMTAAHYHAPETFAEAEGTEREPYVNKYKNGAYEFYTVGRERYQTMLTMRSVPPKKGLQTWGVKGSAPLLYPGSENPSTIRMWGFDLASRDVSLHDWTRRGGVSPEGNALPYVSAAHGSFVASYIFSPHTTLIVHTGNAGDRETRWCGDEAFHNGFTTHGDHASADGVEGTMHWWGDPPALEDDGFSLVFRSDGGVQAFALAAGQFTRHDTAQIEGEAALFEWSDPSGHYVAVVNGTARSIPAVVRLPDGSREELQLGRGECHVIRLP